MAATMACGGSGSGSETASEADTVVTYTLPDTLRVGTLYSPASYFIYRETEMGYDYDLVKRFAADKWRCLIPE